MPHNADIYYYAYHAENTERIPIVLIHGAGGNHLNWPVQIRRLPERRVYALDLPGHGKSNGHGWQQIADYSGRILAWMDEVGLYKVVLVGHSMGGAIALNMALQYPERIRGLGLVGTGANLPVNDTFLENTSNETTFQSTVEMLSSWAFSLDADPQLVQATQKQMLETRPTTLHGDFAACAAFDVRERLDEITCPTQVICGNEDKLMPIRYSQYLADHIASAELAVIPGAGHMVMLEKPERVAAA
ncbi:MAG: alpha/beta fold hydrolase, partial [Chloroflexota bacterium]|nr:alpha/beta fold hydrolase [Chloroflexota bacterium]